MTKKSRYDMPAVQSFVFGGIANPTQRAVLRDSDATYLTARQRELDDFEVQRQAYNTALQDFQTNVYEPYKAESAAYNTAAEKYNTDVYNPYKTQFDAYTKAAEEYNAGPRTAEYAGPAAPTLASEFTMKAPTSPTAFAEKAPALPFEVADVEAHQKAAAKRAYQDASDRAVAIDVVSDPSRFNFGSMSVSDRFMAEGGEVMASAPTPSGPRLYDAIEDLKKGNKSQAEARMREIVGLPPLKTEAPMPPGPSGPRLYDAIEDLKKGNKSQAEARMREIVGLPPLRTEAPPTAVAPVAAPGSAASDLKKITAVAPPATGSSIPPPPSGDIVPPVPHPDGNTYGSPGSSDGKWFYTNGKWFANEKVYGGPAVFPDSGPQPVVPQPPRPLEPGSQQPVRPVEPQPVRPVETQPVFRQPNDKGMGPKQPPVLPPTLPPYTPVRPPTLPPYTPVRPPPVIAKPRVGKKGAATSPSSYFALTPQTSTGLAPGTAAIGPADMPLYGAKNTMGALGASPNLSPGMLGGQQNAGMFSDRLGNRIYSPAAMPLYGFARGGDIDLNALLAQNAETLSDDTPEDVINTDPLGTAQKMMSDLSSANKANPNVSPTRKAIKQTKSAPAKSSAKSGSAKMQYESLIKGDMGAMGSAPPTLQDTDSAQAQMRELARIYQLKAQASQDRARGFSADTFGAPTLGQPTLTKGKLTKKRFNKGGEAKKSEGDAAEPKWLKNNDINPSDFLAALGRTGFAAGTALSPSTLNEGEDAELARRRAMPPTANRSKGSPESGEAKKPEGDVAEPLQSPEEQPVTEESRASRALGAFVEGAKGYLGLDPGISGSDSYRTGQALSNMPVVGAPGKAAGVVMGMMGPMGIIEAARRSKLFKDKGMAVPSEKFSSSEMLKMLEDQGIDTSRMWLRGKKENSSKVFPQMDYDMLEYLYSSQKRPNAVEAAMRDSRGSQASEGRTLSRQPGDRGITKSNTKGGVWLTESPSIAQTYAGNKGFTIPVYAPKPDVVVDAKGEQWSDFYSKDKDWKAAFEDPKVRLIEVRNVIDAGPHWSSMIPTDASEDELRKLLTATNLFAKKPFDKRVVNKMTGEPYEFKQGGPVKRSKGSPEEGETKKPEGDSAPEVTGINRVIDFIAQRLPASAFPTAGKTLLETVQGKQEPITESNFSSDELDVMRQLVNTKKEDKGAVTYADYSNLAKQMRKKGKIPISVSPSLFSMGDALGNVQTTLGQFEYIRDPQGNLSLIDSYDFNPRNPYSTQETRTGDYGTLGPYGLIREYAGEKVPPGKGRQVQINLSSPVKRSKGSPEEGETSITDQLIGAGETALTLGSGALSSVVGMPYGLYKGLTSGKYLEGKAPAIAEKEAQAFIERNTYVPRSTKGRENLEELNRLMEQSKLPPILPETAMLRSIPRAAVAAQVERTGMAAEKALDKPVTDVLKRGGKSAEMLKALSAPPSNVVKKPGGNWIPEPNLGSVENALIPLKTPLVAGKTPAQRLSWHEELLKDSSLNGLDQDQLDRVQYHVGIARGEVALDNWVDTNMTSYVRKQMGTPDDPVRKLAEEGITHLPQKTGDEAIQLLNQLHDTNADVEVAIRREKAGFPNTGVGTSPQAQLWEYRADEAIRPKQMGDTIRANNPGGLTMRELFTSQPGGEWAAKVPDTETVNELRRPGTNSTASIVPLLGFDHIMDVLREDVTTGRIRPEQLSKVSMADAVRRTHQYDQELAAKMNVARTAAREGLPVYKEYPKGYRWIQLNKPGSFAQESDAMGHSVRGYEPPRGHPDWVPGSGNSGRPSYGHGGWEAIKSGNAKVYSLVDAKGEPHTTVEVSKGKHPIGYSLKGGGEYFPETFEYTNDFEGGVLPINSEQRQLILNRAKELFNNDPTKGRSGGRMDAFQKAADEIIGELPGRISQIKGKGNAAPNKEYLPFVHDFVKSGKWFDVDTQDLGNTGLIKIDAGSNMATSFKRIGKSAPAYLTQDEHTKLLKWRAGGGRLDSLPEGFARGGAVLRRHNKGGSVNNNTAFIKAHS